jgi:phosphatidate cytidylyltransferase
MAFNVTTFKTRALTAVIFVVVMLAGLLWNAWSFLILFTIIHFGCWFEFQRLIAKIDPSYKDISDFHKWGIVLAGYGLMLWMTVDKYTFLNFGLDELGWWFLLIGALVIPIGDILFSKNFSLTSILYSLAGLLYISFSWGCMMQLRGDDFLHIGWILPMLLITSIWINDTMAYIVGSFIGKTPLSPISPKKTWEGTIGGAILCIVVVTLVGYFVLGMTDYVSLIVVSGIAAVIGTLGDLLESKLKRMAGVKDSGSFMPGHGGFLDRFDSLLLATPIMWMYFTFIQKLL